MSAFLSLKLADINRTSPQLRSLPHGFLAPYQTIRTILRLVTHGWCASILCAYVSPLAPLYGEERGIPLPVHPCLSLCLGRREVSPCLYIPTCPSVCQYGEESGIPLRVLRDQMEDSSNKQMLPQSKVDQLLHRADEDKDGYLDYNEFVNLVRSRSIN